jgi:hypothetical protein
MKVEAQSGRPVHVLPRDAARAPDFYLNNPKYVGAPDHGPIPEGNFRFSASQFVRFSLAERTRLEAGGNFVDASGAAIHGGDWGAGRTPLSPVSIKPAAGGGTGARSGFYLHGGVMPGSSGCIDIGNSGVDRLLELLDGYTGAVQVDLKYAYPAPDVGGIEHIMGRFTYPEGKKDPSLWERIRNECCFYIARNRRYFYRVHNRLRRR